MRRSLALFTQLLGLFNQIIGFYKSIRSGKLKIVLTVRDYAFQEMALLCQEFSPSRIDLMKLN